MTQELSNEEKSPSNGWARSHNSLGAPLIGKYIFNKLLAQIYVVLTIQLQNVKHKEAYGLVFL